MEKKKKKLIGNILQLPLKYMDGYIGVGTDDEIRHTLHTGNHSFSVKNHTLRNPGCSELNVNSKDMH